METSTNIILAVRQFLDDFVSKETILSERSVDRYIHDYTQKCRVTFNDYDIYLASGLTKLCLTFHDIEDFVIKIPLIHDLTIEAEEELISSSQEKIKSNDYDFYEEDMSDDYCATEAGYFADAEEMGIGDFFAKEMRISEYKGVPIYAQERVKCSFHDSDRWSDEVNPEIWSEIEAATQDLYLYDGADDLFSSEVFLEDVYCFSDSPEQFVQLLRFLSDMGINDLHNENFGYDFAGRPKIFDYSGF